MFSKSIDVEVDAASFPSGSVPSSLNCPPSVSIDIAKALLMLGTLTTPSGFSRASPARYWAWVRYFAAVHSSTDLRITGPFVDLDPHQKTILSDDFGVAITTKWLHDRLNGFAEIVDGRRFMLHYKALLNGPSPTSTPKVGLGKCPDYVVRDPMNRWHVIECKGTQKSLSYHNSQLLDALQQKKIIDVAGSVKGERLALGLFLANERKRKKTKLRVVDPEVDPYVIVNDQGRARAVTAMSRLAASRALALSGFDEIAEELSLPTEMDRFRQADREALFSAGERRRLARPVNTRWEVAIRALRAQPRRKVFEVGNQSYVGPTTEVAIPGDSFKANTNGCTMIRVNQGVNLELLDRLENVSTSHQERVDDITGGFVGGHKIGFLDSDSSTTLLDGNLFAAKLEFLD